VSQRTAARHAQFAAHFEDIRILHCSQSVPLLPPRQLAKHRMDAMTPPDFDALLADTNFVRRLAGALVRDPNVADDLAQEALVVALERPPRDGRNLRGWMASVVRSRAFERARQASARPCSEALAPTQSPVPTPGEIVARLDTSRQVAEAVRELEEPYRTTIFLRYVEECETRVVAERLGVPLTTVKTRLRPRLRPRLLQESSRCARQ